MPLPSTNKEGWSTSAVPTSVWEAAISSVGWGNSHSRQTPLQYIEKTASISSPLLSHSPHTIILLLHLKLYNLTVDTALLKILLLEKLILTKITKELSPHHLYGT
jgi:hypothetical protein